jgi:hypothetical protein
MFYRETKVPKVDVVKWQHCEPEFLSGGHVVADVQGVDHRWRALALDKRRKKPLNYVNYTNAPKL